MNQSEKINKLAKRLIEVSTVNGEVDTTSLWQGILKLKEKRFRHLLPLLRLLRTKVAQKVAWQTLEVTSSSPLSASALESLEKRFTQKYRKSVKVKSFIDPSLIGGLKVRIGDDVYDASITAQLNQIANQV